MRAVPQGDVRGDERSPPLTRPRNQLVLITGMSGAGKTTVLKALEDSGYEAVDNLPLSLISRLVRPSSGEREALAIHVDIRTRDFGAQAFEAATKPLLEQGNLNLRVLFIDCEDEVLRRRFTATRRRHPLAADRPLIDGIRHERHLIGWLRDRADVDIDTTSLAVADLRRMVTSSFALEGRTHLSVFVTSFSYGLGIPREADLVFDARFLVNPHYEDHLRPLTGMDPAVGEYVRADPGFAAFFDSLTRLVQPLLPRFKREGKSYLTIAIGCTGGRHRSVYVASRLAHHLDAAGQGVHLRHRDLESISARSYQKVTQ